MDIHPVILFDGVCKYCCASVNFIIKRDSEARFKFAPLQSEAGRAVMNRYGIEPGDMSSLILVDEGTVYSKSEAALRISDRLGGWARIFSIFRILPVALRDSVYDLIARHRYNIFGKKDECMVPTPDVRERFLD